jgi:hypothetical protein
LIKDVTSTDELLVLTVGAAAVFVDKIRAGSLQGRPVAQLFAESQFEFDGSRLGPQSSRLRTPA